MSPYATRKIVHQQQREKFTITVGHLVLRKTSCRTVGFEGNPIEAGKKVNRGNPHHRSPGNGWRLICECGDYVASSRLQPCRGGWHYKEFLKIY